MPNSQPETKTVENRGHDCSIHTKEGSQELVDMLSTTMRITLKNFVNQHLLPAGILIAGHFQAYISGSAPCQGMHYRFDNVDGLLESEDTDKLEALFQELINARLKQKLAEQGASTNDS